MLFDHHLHEFAEIDESAFSRIMAKPENRNGCYE